MTRSRLAWGLAAVDTLIFIVAVVLDPAPASLVTVLFALGIGAYVGIGALLAGRVPGNPIGGLLIATGTFGAAAAVFSTYADLGALRSPPWPGVELAQTVRESIFLYPVVIALVLIPLVFPDGRLPSPRFRLVVLLAIAGMIGWLLGSVFDASVDLVVLVSVPVAFGGAVTAVTLRFRNGDAIHRQQIKWLAAVVIVGTTAVLAGLLINDPLPDLGTALIIVGIMALFALPFVIGMAILRYRLYEIDRIVSRTLAYLIITGLLVATYALIVVIVGGPLAGLTGGDTISVALSTLAVAALFQPLRRRVQSLVDRRFDRARYDGQRLADAFAGRLRDEVDIATVTADLDATVRAAVRPTTAALWVRGRDG
jgi:hypothetical protein